MKQLLGLVLVFGLVVLLAECPHINDYFGHKADITAHELAIMKLSAEKELEEAVELAQKHYEALSKDD